MGGWGMARRWKPVEWECVGGWPPPLGRAVVVVRVAKRGRVVERRMAAVVAVVVVRGM